MSVYVGTVSRQQLATGSKSQRTGFVLRRAEGPTLVLEVAGWGPYRQEVFTPFEGHKCHIEADCIGRRLLARSIKALDDTEMEWSLTYRQGNKCSFCGSFLPDTITEYCPRCGARIP